MQKFRCGVIDVGSNTIRTVIYEITGHEYKTIINEKDFCGIISYVKNGCLEEDGLLRIQEILEKMQMLCELLHCTEIYCFATASLRHLKNLEAVLDRFAEIGLQIQILSGEEEAECDFYGLLDSISEKNGVGLDLGGGSGQLIQFADQKLQRSASFPIGSLALYNRFVRGLIPTEVERKNIRDYVRAELERAPDLFKIGSPILYGMGGTVRAAGKLHRALTGSDATRNGYLLTVEQLENLCDLMCGLDMYGVKLMERVAPERITTILPGMLAIRSACEYIGAQKIQIVKSGVREGYLWKNIINRSNNR